MSFLCAGHSRHIRECTAQTSTMVLCMGVHGSDSAQQFRYAFSRVTEFRGARRPSLFSRLVQGACACLFCSHLLCLTLRFCALVMFLAVRQSLLRVEDLWEGYKLLCYSFYSHSVPHEEEFRQCKLGAYFYPPPPDFRFLPCFASVGVLCACIS